MIENPKLKILVVDDNPSIHQDFKKILSKKQYSQELEKLAKDVFDNEESTDYTSLMPDFIVDSASQGAIAVEMVREAVNNEQPYLLAFVDIRMPPGLDGIETIKRIWEIDKEIQVVICTAYSDYSWSETISNLGQSDNLLILKKPFDNITIRQIACALTKKWLLSRSLRLHTKDLENTIRDKINLLDKTSILIEKSLSLIKTTFESSYDGILIIDDSGNILDYNEKFEKMWGVRMADISELNDALDIMKTNLDSNDLFIKNFKILHEDPLTVRLDHIHFKNNKIYEYYTQPFRINGVYAGRIYDFRDVTRFVNSI